MPAGHVRLVRLRKQFGGSTAVDGIDLEIHPGEFFSLLGPSGCGKTTTLRMVAGFEQPTSGEVQLDGRDVAGTAPSQRNVNTVFQSYALFPHLTVARNVEFGLRRQGVRSAELRSRVAEALELVRLTDYASRKPGQLSGGQQQRVALARALVLRPAVLLLDEPLGALDAKLRRQLQLELKALQQQVGTTFVYVTHDQEEALTMSDRLAVLNRGRVEQVGPPQQVYDEPQTAFVADFLGLSNVLQGTVVPAPGGNRVRLDGGLTLEVDRADGLAAGAVTLVVRPERIRVEAAGTSGQNRVPGLVSRSVYLGSGRQLEVQLADGQLVTVLVQNTEDTAPDWPTGTAVTCFLPATALRVLGGTVPDPVPTAAGS